MRACTYFAKVQEVARSAHPAIELMPGDDRRTLYMNGGATLHCTAGHRIRAPP